MKETTEKESQWKTVSAVFQFFARQKSQFIESLSQGQTQQFLKLRAYQVFLVLSIVNLLLCIFEVKTLISIMIFALSCYLYVNFRIQIILDKGLLNYFPYSVKFALLRRSLFDILCDMWYFSKIKFYIKAIFSPLILQPSPQEVSKYLNYIPKEERKIFFIKGIAYTFPKVFQKILFPRGKNIHSQIQSFLNDEEEKIYQSNQIHFQEINEPTQQEEIKDKTEVNQLEDINPDSKEVILSSKITRDIDFLPGEFSLKWDNLSEYQRKKSRASNPD